MARPASGPLVDVSFVKPDHAPVPCSGRPQRGLPSVLPLVVLLTLGGCGGTGGGNGGGASGAAVNPVAPSNIEPQPTAALLPTGLAMPIRVDDINLLGVINPFGVVRGSRDRAAVGHAGIDVPLNSGAPLFAVGTGPILSVRPSVDSRPRRSRQDTSGCRLDAGHWVGVSLRACHVTERTRRWQHRVSRPANGHQLDGNGPQQPP